MLRLKVKEVAISKGFNQSRLQLKAQVTPQLVSRYWHNQVQSVAFEPLEKIARALEVDPRELIEVVEDGTVKASDEEDDAA